METIIQSNLNLIAIASIVLTSVFLLLYSKRYTMKKLTVDGFLIDNQNVSGNEFANTFAVSTLSLASTIIFFIEAHQAYGWLMGLGPLFYMAIQFYMLRFVSRLNIDLKKTRTLADLWYDVFPSKSISRSIAILTVLTALMMLFVELLIGSVVVSFFLPDTAFCKAFSFFVLGLIVLAYVYNGGYNVIIKTDNWQFWLMVFSSIAIVYFAVFAPFINETLSIKMIINKLFSYNESGWPLFIFLLWACLINLCICFTDLAAWQRMAASSSIKQAYNGLFKGIWRTLFIFWLPMMSFILLYVKGNQYNAMDQFLVILASQSGLLGYIIFPLVVTGFLTTLFTTADTFMIAILYGLCDRSTFLPKLEAVPEQYREKTMRKYLIMSTLFLVSVLTIFYYINSNEISVWIMPILYAVWAQSAAIAPLALYAIYRLKKGLPPLEVNIFNNTVILATLIGAWLIIIYGSIQQTFTKSAYYPQLSFLISLVIVTCGLAIAVSFPKFQSKTSVKLDHALRYSNS